MKRFYKAAVCDSAPDISEKDLTDFKELLIKEMLRLGATDDEISLIHNAILINAILNNRKPEDVAWAILQ